MIANRASETAMQVCAARAAHLRFDPAPHLLEDEPAAAFLGAAGEAMIASYGNDAPWVLLENRLYLPLRSRYAEDRLREFHAAGGRQYVVLGAGLDGFAFRQPPGLEDLTIYEVDHPDTQRFKRERIDRLGWALPQNLRFVACDFEKTAASSALLRAGFQTERSAFVSWLGVVMYLQQAIVAEALRDLSRLLAPQSEVVFDFMRPWDELSARYAEMRDAITQYLKGAQEPHVNRYRHAELIREIENSGFERARIERREELHARYLARLETSIPLSERFGIAVAGV